MRNSSSWLTNTWSRSVTTCRTRNAALPLPVTGDLSEGHVPLVSWSG